MSLKVKIIKLVGKVVGKVYGWYLKAFNKQKKQQFDSGFEDLKNRIDICDDCKYEEGDGRFPRHTEVCYIHSEELRTILVKGF